MMSRPVVRGERGLVMLSLLTMILVLTVLAALVLFLSGKETALTGVRTAGNESLYVAEGGAFAARAALLVYMNAFPQGKTTVDPSLDAATAAAWYADGNTALQNPLKLLDYLVVDGQRLSLGATPLTASETFQINWASGYPNFKLQRAGTPVNALAPGTYTASVTLQPNLVAHSSCHDPTGTCAVHQNAPNAYEIFYKYAITSDGQVAPRFRRRVTLTGAYSVVVRPQSLALYELFTHVHMTPSGSPVWFTTNTSFTGPVHTNGEFRFGSFPTFASNLESASLRAWYNNAGSPVELATNANVQNGSRIDAPLVPPVPTPQSAAPANFTLGAPSVPLPNNAVSQQGAALGRNPADTSPVTAAHVTSAIPELKGSGSVPNGIYVPVADSVNNCRSNIGATMNGGIYVQGDLNGLAMSVAGRTAVYRLVQGAMTVTVTVDRAKKQTTVASNAWLPSPSGGGCPGSPPGAATRTFVGVPKGWRGLGNPNATIIFVNGNVLGLSGFLQQNEQTTIAAAGSIVISGNIRYQTPPNPSDPESNPTNVLGLYASGGDIIIGPTAPRDVIIQGVLMAGNMTSGYSSSVNVYNFGAGRPRGAVNLLGGVIEKYYGQFGAFDQTGAPQSGYALALTYDTRMSRGLTPPYFPASGVYTIDQGSQRLDGQKPTWREGTPP